jgi:hypothetical protein
MVKFKKFLGFVLFLILIVSINQLNTKCSNKQSMKFYMELNFNGIISKKFINKSQHNYPILEIKQSGKKIQEVNLSTDNSGLFEYVQENDSIVKKHGLLTVHVYRNAVDTVFTLSWNNY